MAKTANMLTTTCTAFDDVRSLDVIAVEEPGDHWPISGRVIVGIDTAGQTNQDGEPIEFAFGLTPDGADRVADALHRAAARARIAAALPREERKPR